MQRHLHTHHRRQQLALGVAKLLDGLHEVAGATAGSLFALGKVTDGLRGGLQGRRHYLDRANRRHQAEDHARQGRVGAGLQQAEPEQGAGQHVGIGGADADVLQAKYQQDAGTGDGETQRVQAAGVEQRNDQHRDYVVDDRQGQQEDAHRRGHGTAQQGQDADGEGDVGSGRHRPALAQPFGVVEAEIEQGRHQHAAAGGNHGQCGQLEVGQGAFVYLPADFHTDHQKEHRHQGIVDPEMQGVRDDEITDTERQRHVPEMFVAAGVGRVGPDQRSGGRDQQDNAADGFDVEELLERGECLVGNTLRSRQRFWGRGVVHGCSYSAACAAARPTHETCRTG
ncbi:hypothetical protein D9M72_304980 [compost metagenome]